ncbi:MAG: homoserine kinase, partial [Anaerolineaceae bacterium]|nr:homoserine kinase [Anaerolineaceae bacterium]
MNRVQVRAPATTANLGPGFDCLGLALDLWNEATFELSGKGVHVAVQGLGKGCLPEDSRNLVARMALRVFQTAGQAPPPGLSICCENRIPPGSGLGSSAAAALCGLVGANALLGQPLSNETLLALAVESEGHPDNAAAALYGGLVISAALEPGVVLRRVELPVMQVSLAVPQFELSTRAARQALPGQVALRDAVFNIGRAALVVEALRAGDLELLGNVMHDRLHQPYRLRLIPGAGA